MVFDWMMMAVSPRVRDLLSVVIVRVTLHEVKPSAIATAVAIATARYLIAFMRRCFCSLVSCMILVEKKINEGIVLNQQGREFN